MQRLLKRINCTSKLLFSFESGPSSLASIGPFSLGRSSTRAFSSGQKEGEIPSIFPWQYPANATPSPIDFYEKLLHPREKLPENMRFLGNGFSEAALAQKPAWIRAASQMHQSPAAAIRRHNIRLAVQTFARWPGDNASLEVQLAVDCVKIFHLEQHTRLNRHDFRSVRRMTTLRHRRSRLLRALKRRSLERYFVAIRDLKLTPEEVHFMPRATKIKRPRFVPKVY